MQNLSHQEWTIFFSFTFCPVEIITNLFDLKPLEWKAMQAH